MLLPVNTGPVVNRPSKLICADGVISFLNIFKIYNFDVRSLKKSIIIKFSDYRTRSRTRSIMNFILLLNWSLNGWYSYLYIAN